MQSGGSGDRVIAVVEQHTSELGVRGAPSTLEKADLELGRTGEDDHRGAFPIPSDATHLAFSPLVGDGLHSLVAGDVMYVSRTR